MNDIRRVLVTGAGGLIGGIVRRSLAGAYTLSGVDRAPLEDFYSLVADISDLPAIQPAFEGVDAVVHLAADAGNEAPWDSVLPNNIVGTYNVFEAVRAAGVKRVVFASSNHATGMYECDHPYSAVVAGRYEGLSPGAYPMVDHRMPIRPDGYYGVAKQYGESLARYYHEEHGISFACLRIGTVNRDNNPLASVRQFATLCTHRDIAQLVRLCLEADDLRFEIFYGVSDNTWRFWDIDHARERVGYAPEDDTESWRARFEGEQG
jgi:nucleoside-diphosphate-sugar epimerase